MTAHKFTKGTLDALQPPVTGRLEISEPHSPGLKFRVTSGGAKSWSLLYRINGLQHRFTIGPWPTIDIAAARKKAAEARDKIAKGVDPAGEKAAGLQAARALRAARKGRKIGVPSQAAPGTFHALMLDYLNWLERNRASKTYHDTSILLMKETPPIWHKPASAVTADDVLELVRKVDRRGAGVQANRLLSWLKAVFNWGIGQRLLKDADGKHVIVSPLVGIKRPNEEKPGERTLSNDEIVWFWTATESLGYPHRDLFRLLLLTAQRLREVAGMRWSEVVLEERKRRVVDRDHPEGAWEITPPTWTLAGRRVKNGVAHVVTLSPQAVEILKSVPRIAGSDFVFPTASGEKAVDSFSWVRGMLERNMVKARAETLGLSVPTNGGYEPKFVLHDLRRTAATGMAAMKIPPQVVDRILNHTSGTIKGVAAIYNRFEYHEERAAALIAWGNRIEHLVSPTAPSNIVALQDRAKVST
jgi:integrase